MLAYIVRRLIAATPMLVGALAIAFLLLRLAPGGPFGGERELTPAIEARLEADYGQGLPLGEQIARYLAGLARGDLGPSMVFSDKDVLDLLAEGAPVSGLLGLSALALALLLGGALGAAAALAPRRLADHAAAVSALLGLCLAPLVAAPIVQWLFGVELGAAPVRGLHRDELHASHLVLPIAALSLAPMAIFAHATRTSLAQVLASRSVFAARARGIPAARVLWTHAYPLALLGLRSGFGLALASAMAGLLAVETVFQLPGVGRQVVLAAGQRDYTFVAGAALVLSVLVVLSNIASELLARRIDPRLRAP